MNEQRGRARDSQRSRVYAAERPLHTLGYRERGVEGVITRIERIIERLPELDWPSKLEVGDGRGRRAACASRNTAAYGYVKFPLWARTPVVICHELAHVVVCKNAKLAAHGPEFCRMFIYILSHEHPTGAFALRDAYVSKRVRVSNQVDSQFLSPIGRQQSTVVEYMHKKR